MEPPIDLSSEETREYILELCRKGLDPKDEIGAYIISLLKEANMIHTQKDIKDKASALNKWFEAINENSKIEFLY